MTPETDIVLRCARAFFSPDAVAPLQAIVEQRPDWQAVESQADALGVLPIVADVLVRHAGGSVSPEVLLRWKGHLGASARKSLRWLEEWQRLLGAFDENDVRVITFKGPALALIAYPSVMLREFTDLDLLVRRADVLKARETLLREGYCLKSAVAAHTESAMLRSQNRQISFAHPQRGTMVEVHWGVLHKMFAFQLEGEQLFDAARVECRDGITFLSLSPEHLLLYLCAHGTKHCWSSLRWLCDLACYVQNVRELDWELCTRLAGSTNCDLVLKHSLLLAQQVLEIALPTEMQRYAGGDAKAQEIAAAASSLLFREDGEPAYRETLRYHLAFAKGWRDRAGFVLTRIFVPAEPDWQKVRMPGFLYFLYYLIRPLRFLLARLADFKYQSRQRTSTKDPV
jgi:hypothetical protein